jgi:hypothetical protein
VIVWILTIIFGCQVAAWEWAVEAAPEALAAIWAAAVVEAVATAEDIAHPVSADFEVQIIIRIYQYYLNPFLLNFCTKFFYPINYLIYF